MLKSRPSITERAPVLTVAQLIAPMHDGYTTADKNKIKAKKRSERARRRQTL
jgi:hypothetical protein